MSLFDLNLFCEEANSSNSMNHKLAVLKKYPQCIPLFKYTYDTINYQYGVSSANLKKLEHIIADECPDDYQDIFEGLNSREWTGHEAIGIINRFIADQEYYRTLIYNIIDRNLKTRTDAKLINKVFPGAIPEFSVALAETYKEETAKHVDFEKQMWFCSRKLDGVRCIAIIDEKGQCKFYSRNGKEFLTLANVKKEIESLGLTNFVLDGELCLIDESGNENFTQVMKYIRKKDYTIPNPKYLIFDGLQKLEFEAKYSDTLFLDRLKNLLKIVPKGMKHLHLLKQILLKNEEAFGAFRTQAQEEGWEGLILRRNDPYEGKRSRNMFKVKKFYDAEFEIKSVTMGPFRHIDPETGLEIETELLSRVAIEYKGNMVGVGSGFSLAQRKYYHEHPDELIGKTVTVCYFEESHDENGIPSLRFPTIKHIYEEGRTT